MCCNSRVSSLSLGSQFKSQNTARVLFRWVRGGGKVTENPQCFDHVGPRPSARCWNEIKLKLSSKTELFIYIYDHSIQGNHLKLAGRGKLKQLISLCMLSRSLPLTDPSFTYRLAFLLSEQLQWGDGELQYDNHDKQQGKKPNSVTCQSACQLINLCFLSGLWTALHLRTDP